jgi:hypothetical protein
MAERIKDNDDRLLETMFASERIADDGFSKAVVRRIRRKLLVRKLSLPIAALVGGIIAFKPMSALLDIVSQLSLQLPQQLAASAMASLPAVQFIVTGGLVTLVAVMTLSMLED